MHAHDRYILATAVLDGDRDARKVLADLLEEQGERSLAQWARQGRSPKHRRLEFVLMLLPCRTAIGLAKDFVVHAFTDRQDVRLLDRFPTFLAQWCTGELENEGFLAFCRGYQAGMPLDWGVVRPRLKPRGESNPHLKIAIECLIEAARFAVFAAQSAAGEPVSGTPEHSETMAIQQLRIVATACRRQALLARRPAKPTPADTEIDFQIERTKASLQQLLMLGSA